MNENRIRRIIIQAAGSYKPDDEVRAFVLAFREKYGDNLEGVIFYGSCLAAKMRKSSSVYDFFIILREYGPIARGIIDRLILSLMPPNQYYLTLDHSGGKLETKYHVLTLREFRRLSTTYAPDHYVIGRISKRTALIWSKDDSAREIILDSIANAFFSNARIVTPLITEQVDFKGLVIAYLRASYLGELRLELPEKIEQIYESERQFYDELYGMLAEDLVKSGQLTLHDDRYRASSGGSWPARKAKLYLMQSKSRHIIRFPKLIRAMDNWLEQLLGKYERTYGKPLELTDWEKRHKLYTVLKYLYRIKVLKK